MRIGVLGIKLSDPDATVMRMIRFMRAIGAGTAAVAMLISGATVASAQGQGSINADSLGGTPGSSSLASVDVFGSLGSLAGTDDARLEAALEGALERAGYRKNDAAEELAAEYAERAVDGELVFVRDAFQAMTADGQMVLTVRGQKPVDVNAAVRNLGAVAEVPGGVSAPYGAAVRSDRSYVYISIVLDLSSITGL